MSGIILTAYDGAILGPIAKVLGWIMNGIYNGISFITGGRVESVVLSILVITIIIYMCLLPLTIKQQKFSKLQQKMQPELSAIQEKYKNKKNDQAAMQAMQQETSLVYQKYGVSPMGSCVQLLIQMPILFALYRVFSNIPGYISGVRDSFDSIVTQIMATDGYQDKLVDIVTNFNVNTTSKITSSTVADLLSDAGSNTETIGNYIVDILYKLPSNGWDAISGKDYFPDLASVIESTHNSFEHYNYFLGLNISDTPWYLIKNSWFASSKPEGWLLIGIVALLIPALSYLTQVINIKLMPQAATSGNGNSSSDQMAAQMKTMNTMMPLISLFFCFTVPVALGLYWIFSAAVRGVQQFFVNKHIANLDLDDVIKKNQEKAKKKREKLGISENYIRDAANIKTKTLDSKSKVNMSDENKEKIDKAAEVKSNAKEGSLAYKANLVKEFNERNSRK